MRSFHLSDPAFAALAAGRPSPETLGELRKAQQSRHLLLLSEILHHPGGRLPRWYADSPADLADPMAALHTADTLAALRSGADPPPSWSAATRHLTATHHGLTLRVRLEDTDPLRAHLGLTPSRQLTEPEAASWQSRLDEAWQLLTARHRAMAAVVAEVLSVLVPIEPDPSSGGMSATSADAYGAVAISPPPDARALAVGLLHETQHNLLNATRTLFDLVTPRADRSYSPWRDDPRPPFGILHGAYAYQAVTRFWRTEAAHLHHVETPPRSNPANATPHPEIQPGPRDPPTHPAPADPIPQPGIQTRSPRLPQPQPQPRQSGERRLAEFEFARWRAAVVDAADAMLGRGVLTAAGRRFVRAMRDEVAPWLDEAVDADVARLAAGANAEHRARWRLRNLIVAPEAVSAVIAAWHSGKPAPSLAEPALRDDPGRVLEQSARLRLVHRSLRDPAAAEGAPEGDAAYLRGDHETAFTAYGMDWVGLAVVSPHRALRERPELVKAVHEALTPGVDLHNLADWLSG